MALLSPPAAAPGVAFFTAAELLGLARLSGFVRRKLRKLDLHGFLLSCMVLALEQSGSLRRQAMLAGLIAGTPLSKQALHQRLARNAASFLQACLAAALAARLPERRDIVSAHFARIFVQDSSCLSLPARLAGFFPGAANQTGKAQASVRVQCIYELLREQFVWFQLTAFTRNDQAAAGELLPLLQPDDLVLRDLGFFTLQSFKGIAAKGAFFLSRLRYGVSVFSPDGHPLQLRRQLRAGTTVEFNVLLGHREKIPVRVVAVALPEAAANERRRKARANRDQRLCHSEDYYHLLGWNIFITNASAERLPQAMVAKLYRLRWRIEIVFKAWKSHLGLTQASRLGAHQVEALIYGLLLSVVLLHRHLPPPGPPAGENERPPPDFSLLRLCELASSWLFALLFAHLTPAELRQRMHAQIHVHCRYERRRRKNYAQFRSEILT